MCLPWAILKIFHWTCLFLHFYKVLCKPYSIIWWYKVNEKMKQQREQKRWWKLKSEFCIVWKSSFREGKKHKNETLRPATNATKSPKNVLIPQIKPIRESIRVLLATSKTFAMLSSCWSTKMFVRTTQETVLVIRPEAWESRGKHSSLKCRVANLLARKWEERKRQNLGGKRDNNFVWKKFPLNLSFL